MTRMTREQQRHLRAVERTVLLAIFGGARRPIPSASASRDGSFMRVCEAGAVLP